jgi:hypothetical protein
MVRTDEPSVTHFPGLVFATTLFRSVEEALETVAGLCGVEIEVCRCGVDVSPCSKILPLKVSGRRASEERIFASSSKVLCTFGYRLIGVILALSLWNLSSVRSIFFAIYFALSIAASMLKFRLPEIEAIRDFFPVRRNLLRVCASDAGAISNAAAAPIAAPNSDAQAQAEFAECATPLKSLRKVFVEMECRNRCH